MQQHDSKYFARRHILDPGIGSKDKKKSFARGSYVTYQIKGNGA